MKVHEITSIVRQVLREKYYVDAGEEFEIDESELQKEAVFLSSRVGNFNHITSEIKKDTWEFIKKELCEYPIKFEVPLKLGFDLENKMKEYYKQ